MPIDASNSQDNYASTDSTVSGSDATKATSSAESGSDITKVTPTTEVEDTEKETGKEMSLTDPKYGLSKPERTITRGTITHD